MMSQAVPDYFRWLMDIYATWEQAFEAFGLSE